MRLDLDPVILGGKVGCRDHQARRRPIIPTGEGDDGRGASPDPRAGRGRPFAAATAPPPAPAYPTARAGHTDNQTVPVHFGAIVQPVADGLGDDADVIHGDVIRQNADPSFRAELDTGPLNIPRDGSLATTDAITASAPTTEPG